MKPATKAGRATRWLLAAGIAFASFGATHSFAQTPETEIIVEDLRPLEDGLTLEEVDPDRPEEPGTELEREPIMTPFFSKVGSQTSCEQVVYRLSFGLVGDPEIVTHPNFDTLLQNIRLDLSDRIPSGLEIVDVEVTGDVTGAGGGPVPVSVVGTTATPNDTLTIADLRLSGHDLDGDGSPTLRNFYVTITAEIDHAAFPAPVMVDNQAVLTLSRGGGGSVEALSHDPALPDDGEWVTGDPTKVLIDVTDCDPPPPPPPPGGGDEPCFVVATGEVDCAPGVGVYTYHMTVGPEMAGNVITLDTDMPGITVTPASQVVPPGGGVLSWTISGAAPGDVIHLVAVGVETYAGPAEGVGLCCTQVIDIVIPEDLDCPDEDGEPDIRIDKRTEDAQCTIEGPCDFTIRATNAGDAPYTGKIVLEEVTAPGDATVISGPNAPWNCAPMTSPMLCEHPEVTLDPGEFVELDLGFQPGPAWTWGVIRNCAEYDYTASGKGPFGDPTNDKACASIPICIPGKDAECTPPDDDPRTDVGVRKRAEPVNCTEDGVCTFVIDIINLGDTTIDGPMTVMDEFPIHPPVSAEFQPSPPWSCVPESGILFRCEHPGITLVPGASTSIFVTSIVNVDDYPTNEVENCAEVVPLPGETDLTNNRSCATALLPRPQEDPNLRIEKTGDATCMPGEPCTFEITISNAGPGDFSGPVNIGDALQVEGLGAVPVPIDSVSPPFGCAPEPTELPFSCETNLTLGAGESQSHEVTVTIPAEGVFTDIGDNGLQGRNCVAVVEPGTRILREDGERETEMLTIIPPQGEDRPYDCHDFTILPVEREAPQCSPGFVMNDDGRCVCPQGTTFRNGECVGQQTAPTPVPTPRPTPPPQTQQCDLLPGQIRTRDGRCVCPSGSRLRGGRCVQTSQPTPPADPQCRLLPGQVRTQDGECVCPRGTRLRGGRCVQISQPTPPPQRCLQGQVRNNRGECVCRRGTRLRGNRCVPVPQRPQCKQGQVLQNGRCVTIQRRCPQGTVGTPPNCRQVQIQPRPPVRVRPPVIERVLPRLNRRNDQQQNRQPNQRRQQPGILRRLQRN